MRGTGIRTRFRSVDSAQLCLPVPPVLIARNPLSRFGAAHHARPRLSATLIPPRRVKIAGSRHTTGEPLRGQLRADSYEVFREQGPSVGSGVVEAGCMTAVRDRCMRSGMHWTVGGAKALLAVCCSVIGRRHEDCGKRNPAAA